MFGTKLTFSRKENLRCMLKRRFGGIDWSGKKVIFVTFSLGSVGQPSFPLPSS